MEAFAGGSGHDGDYGALVFMLVIAFCGKKYSGKDQGCNYLVSKYGFKHLDYSKDVLNPILEKEGKAITRDNQIELATKLRKEKGIHVLTEMIAEKINSNSMISGLRFKEEVDYLRKKFEKEFILVAVEADERIRYERSLAQQVKGEGSHTFEQFLERESLPTEKVIPETMRLADYTVTNNGSKEELYRQLDIILKNMHI